MFCVNKLLSLFNFDFPRFPYLYIFTFYNRSRARTAVPLLSALMTKCDIIIIVCSERFIYVCVCVAVCKPVLYYFLTVS